MLSSAVRLLPHRIVGCAIALALLLSPEGPAAAAGQRTIATVAVFPVENLSGGPARAEEIRRSLIETLASQGIAVLQDDALDAFMAQHRVRYAAGIDAATAASLRQEAGVEGVLFASIELSNETPPPQCALIARLVSTGSLPTVMWTDDVAVSGDEAPGFLQLGVVSDYRTVEARALNRVSNSLLAYLKGTTPGKGLKAASKFRPKSHRGGLGLEPGRSYSVAVVPFVNLSERRNAGDVLALLFARHLSSSGSFRVLEPGVTRQQLIDARIIMAGGLSVSDAETVAALVDADFVLGGRVLRYEDYTGPLGTARVDFSTVLIERKSRKVVWASKSYNDGNDGVWFFDRGTSRTAHAMATQMVRLTTEMIVGRGR